MTSDQYPDSYPACIMCGAAEGQPCTYISTCHDEHYDQDAGDRRPEPHAARSKPGQPGPAAGFVPVKDEGEWTDSGADTSRRSAQLPTDLLAALDRWKNAVRADRNRAHQDSDRRRAVVEKASALEDAYDAFVATPTTTEEPS